MVDFPPMNQRLHIRIHGLVQGVGFRPFVHHLAGSLRLNGYVLNDPQGVEIEAEGAPEALALLLLRLPKEKPALASIQGLESAYLDPVGYAGFEIRPSGQSGERSALVLPDIATCPDCLAEVMDPADRHYRYPFTNCTHCGPRYSIILALPYDRAATTLASFALCADCRREYEDPANRRFHAQPTACPACGPQLALWDAAGQALASKDDALRLAGQMLREGRIVAVKSLGGFHLMVDARNEDAISRLREAKHREEKPFALLFPSLDCIRGQCLVDDEEARLLASPEAPIVLLRRRRDAAEPLPASLAPQNPLLGCMLPSNPLHHLLAADLGFPLVATSGNLSDEPICTDEHEALERLAGLAELFLVHDRPIARHVDDSISRVMLGRGQVLRRARGHAPLAISLPLPGLKGAALAHGGHLKNSLALRRGPLVFVSQHIGDLDTPQAQAAHQRVAQDLPRLLGAAPLAAAHDLHPDYASTRLAQSSGLPCIAVQHHHAHIAACMADNGLDGEVLGLAWDGTGFGPDGTVWGGEFLACGYAGYRRIAHLRQFRLAGGDAAARDPRRSLLGCLHALHGSGLLRSYGGLRALSGFSGQELALLVQMLDKGLNAPFTSSMGRLFDAAAALAGFERAMRHEGQAAMALEALVRHPAQAPGYGFPLLSAPGLPLVADWGPCLEQMAAEALQGVDPALRAERFHSGLAGLAVAVAQGAGLSRVCLSGGCFQNQRLLQAVKEALERAGFRAYWHQRVPCNDGGISLGQAAAQAALAGEA